MHDVDITVNGNLVHFALIVEFEHVSFDKAATYNSWWKAMKEEITSIERN